MDAPAELVEAQADLQLKVELTGHFTQSPPARFGEPGYGDDVESIEIDGLFAITWEQDFSHRGGAFHGRHVTHDLLKGIDRDSSAFQQLCANILEALGADAAVAISEAAE